jgi:hypothetical protein
VSGAEVGEGEGAGIRGGGGVLEGMGVWISTLTDVDFDFFTGRGGEEEGE